MPLAPLKDPWRQVSMVDRHGASTEEVIRFLKYNLHILIGRRI